MPDDLEPLLTVQQVADILGVSAKTVRKWQYAGELPFVKVGALVRFEPSAISSVDPRESADEVSRTPN